ncbi:hypothetical protein VMCG_06776 [Cytospora schulzeri]|uniref:Clr5 domain-containing protein n=1 Tax=Cytospora schulzeri TaxID=448051 RepID=A0A423W5N8_9PEZI|nr:hypothetical protein VMCG_06776 [Valsa malicola]
MSGYPRRRKPDPDDAWQKNEAEIRRLYMLEEVTEVKKYMEGQGFPNLKTWHEKLGVLGIKKNVTSREWHKIWQNVQLYLEDPTRPKGDLKLKRTKGKIAIYAHGRLYNWNQAWKNMKSAGAVPPVGFPLTSPSKGFHHHFLMPLRLYTQSRLADLVAPS